MKLRNEAGSMPQYYDYNSRNSQQKTKCSLVTAILLASSVVIPSNVVAAETAEPCPIEIAPVKSSEINIEAFKNITNRMEKGIEDDLSVGSSTILVKDGKPIYCASRGFADRESGLPMAADTIVKVHSMTKPVVGIAALQLFEKGAFRWRDPVSKYIPEFKDVKIAIPKGGVNGPGEDAYELQAPEREIEIIDLARHTTGWSGAWPMNESGKPLVKNVDVWTAHGIFDQTLEEWIPDLVKTPLRNQPGTSFDYQDINVDTLGRLVEIWSGKSLSDYLEEEIFNPLKMNDTAFYVPEEKLDRLAVSYTRPDKDSKLLPATAETPGGEPVATQQPAFLFSGGGLYSTATDYARLVQMLTNGGELDGSRILSPKAIALMGSDTIEPGTAMPDDLVQSGTGIGITVSIDGDPGQSLNLDTEGSFGLGGYAGSLFWVDPKNHFGGVYMEQVLPPADRKTNRYTIRSMSFEALE
ncbi:serine hydrolase [Roseibium sp. RKSG952]|uniref:serine hydrolase domain-containing protein n=1 Tax=Roseibium sp. RKSG952 TaxID=2529384 RepID=UPI0012BCCEAE|nr:serine hydrolase domain-containing protein [Roseibium sp. RKSG952]MTH94801.1 class A beta-lactamase-related serine hydrolase [Roseibium sp. RKSG952]